MEVKSRRAEHAADTRRALVTAARRLLSKRGYAATSLDDVCERARVTKGALYHHFRNKEDLFAAVLEEVEADFVAAGVAAVAPNVDVWDALRAAGGAFLDVCARGDTRRIIVEGPAVLGWDRCRDVEHGQVLGLLQSALERAVADGSLTTSSPAVLAQLLAALFNEAGMIVANATNGAAARADTSRELDRVLTGLRLPERRSGRNGT